MWCGRVARARGTHVRPLAGVLSFAQLLKATNRLAEAEPLLRRARDICVASLGPDHPSSQIVAKNYRQLREAME